MKIISTLILGILIPSALLYHPTLPPEKKIANQEITTITFVGDIMLSRGVAQHHADDWSSLFSHTHYLKESDITVGNLEGPISDRGVNVGSRFSFRFNPIVTPVLRDAGFDVLSIANNHIGDWGKNAYDDTLTHLTNNQIHAIGTDSLVIIEKNNTTFGFLGITDVGPTVLPILSAKDPNLYTKITEAKKQVDVLLIYFHWGEEYTKHTERQSSLARQSIDAGADGIIGAHPHVVQDIEWYRGKPIIYSLGNYIFDQHFSKETMEGMVVTLSFQGKELHSLTPAISLLDRRFTPQPLHVKESIYPPKKTITVQWVGDMTPSLRTNAFTRVTSFFDPNAIVLGNLEGVFTTASSSKCVGRTNCFAFGDTPEKAAILGTLFDGVLIANNHSYDYGIEGFTETIATLRNEGIIPIGEKNSIKTIYHESYAVALIGASTYPWLTTLEEVPRLVRSAKENHDVVIVLFHAGAEGRNQTIVPKTTEWYLGENRGDVYRFAHEAIDAGADMVLGSGPHVLRGLEQKNNRVIAYSLGNFYGVNGLATDGILGESGIITITLTPQNTVGHFQPIQLIEDIPAEGSDRIRTLVNSLSKSNFGNNRIWIAPNGIFTLRTQ